ncbi:MAG: transglycosylase SLT domain-containing protein [Bdellovibrio sp.]|nr:transglycosylase SLT domain-containing protein [Bdellovibrio sp.]
MMLILAIFTSVFIFIGNGCHGAFFNETQASQGLSKQVLRIGIHQDLYTKSPEKDLVTAFANQYKLKTEFIKISSLEKANELISDKEIDLVFIRTDLSTLNLQGQPSLGYDELLVSVVCSNPLTLAQPIYVPDNLMFITGLKKFRNQFTANPIIETKKTYLELKMKSLEQNAFCFAADSRVAEKSLLSYPKIKKVWQMSYAVPVSWLSTTASKNIHSLFQGWFNKQVRKNEVRHIWDQYESNDFQISALAYQRFFEHTDSRLPKWKKFFKKAAKEQDMPWTLLAAVAYQESKWDHAARSYTGVRGLMQITTKTAQHLGIEDREDPQQSIKGAAVYLKYFYDKTPKTASSYERWTQALAAYNIGWAHLRDARKLAIALNYNSSRWYEFKKVIPKLEQEKYYSKLTFGFARGRETVEFVDSVLGYYDLLNNSFTRPLLTSRDF